MKSCLQFLDLIVQDFSLGKIREIFRFLKLLQKQEILKYTFSLFMNCYLHSRCCCCVVTWRGATPPRVDMRVRPFPWLSAASSGVPRLDGLLSTRVVTRLAGGLVGIKLDVVPAGAPISSWNCSSDG